MAAGYRSLEYTALLLPCGILCVKLTASQYLCPDQCGEDWSDEAHVPVQIGPNGHQQVPVLPLSMVYYLKSGRWRCAGRDGPRP